MKIHLSKKCMALLALAAAILVLALFSKHLLSPSGSLDRYQAFFTDAPAAETVPPGKVKATFLGTSSLLFDDGETQLLIDGFFTRPSLYRSFFSRIASDEATVRSVMARAGMNRLKAIFVSHAHYDHVLDSPAVARLSGAVLYGSKSTLNVGRGAGLPEGQMRLCTAGGSYSVGAFTVTVIASKHSPYFSIMGITNAPDPAHNEIAAPLKQPAASSDFIEGGVGDFLVSRGKHAVLVKGSMSFIKGSLQPYRAEAIFLGVALLSKQGADYQESFFRETAMAVQARRVIPVHWDDFFEPLDSPLEPNIRIGDNFDENMKFLVRKCGEAGMELTLLRGFDSILLF